MSDLATCFGRLDRRLTTLTWMMGANLILTLLVVGGLLLLR